MSGPWQQLRDGGVPLAMAVSGPPAEDTVLAAAAREAIAGAPRGRDADALAAWLAAWRDHWPTGFARCFGDQAAAASAWARAHAAPEGRYLKLRRIALENLSHVL